MSIGVLCSNFDVFVTTRARIFCMRCILFIGPNLPYVPELYIYYNNSCMQDRLEIDYNRSQQIIITDRPDNGLPLVLVETYESRLTLLNREDVSFSLRLRTPRL